MSAFAIEDGPVYCAEHCMGARATHMSLIRVEARMNHFRFVR